MPSHLFHRHAETLQAAQLIHPDPVRQVACGNLRNESLDFLKRLGVGQEIFDAKTDGGNDDQQHQNEMPTRQDRLAGDQRTDGNGKGPHQRSLDDHVGEVADKVAKYFIAVSHRARSSNYVF
ncbi:hypothetical protein D3C74_279770 [compost metagenome]